MNVLSSVPFRDAQVQGQWRPNTNVSCTHMLNFPPAQAHCQHHPGLAATAHTSTYLHLQNTTPARTHSEVPFCMSRPHHTNILKTSMFHMGTPEDLHLEECMRALQGTPLAVSPQGAFASRTHSSYTHTLSGTGLHARSQASTPLSTCMFTPCGHHIIRVHPHVDAPLVLTAIAILQVPSQVSISACTPPAIYRHYQD